MRKTRFVSFRRLTALLMPGILILWARGAKPLRHFTQIAPRAGGPWPACSSAPAGHAELLVEHRGRPERQGKKEDLQSPLPFRSPSMRGVNQRAAVRIALGPQSDSKSDSQLQPRESATYSHLIGNNVTRLLIDSRKL